MAYKVIQYFTDLQDRGHVYRVGDTFPRSGKTVSEARVKELASSNNRQGRPLIQEEKSNVDEIGELPFVEVPTTAPKYTKTEINRMPISELRKLASDKGLDAEDMTGAEIKSTLIELFNL